MVKRLIVDPPSGWRYGFPKEYTFKPSHHNLPGEEFEKEVVEWYRDEGYPSKLIEQGMLNHVRFWEEGVEDVT